MMNQKIIWKVLTASSLAGGIMASKAFGADCALHLDHSGGAQVDSISPWLSLGGLGLLSLVILCLRRTAEQLEKNQKDPVSNLNTNPASQNDTPPRWGTWAQMQLARSYDNRDPETSLMVPQPAVRIARKRAPAFNPDGWSLLSQPRPTPNRPSESGRQNVTFFVTPEGKKSKMGQSVA